MSAINADTLDMWKKLAADASAQRPSPGTRVRVTSGRKHKGEEGRVLRHEVNKFRDAFRYGGDANLQLREMMGRSGFRVQIQPDDSGAFWCDADKVEVLS